MRVKDTSEVRRYRPVDYQGLLSFLKSTLSELGYDFLPDGKDADIRDIDRVYIKDRGSFHVLDDKGEIRGCIGVRRFSDEIAELKRLCSVEKIHHFSGPYRLRV